MNRLCLAFVLAGIVSIAMQHENRVCAEGVLLYSFESRKEIDRVKATRGEASLAEQHATDGSHALRVIFEAGRYPNVVFPSAGDGAEVADWSGYSALSLDLYLDTDRPQQLTFILRGPKADRGPCYRHFVETLAADRPYFVGCHWYKYFDAPASGSPLLNTNANFNLGFVDSCDLPYASLVRAAAETNRRIYDLAFNRAQPLRELPPFALERRRLLERYFPHE